MDPIASYTTIIHPYYYNLTLLTHIHTGGMSLMVVVVVVVVEGKGGRGGGRGVAIVERKRFCECEGGELMMTRGSGNEPQR